MKQKTVINGWELIKEYKLFNLWKRQKTGIRECFWKNETPIFRSLIDKE